MHSAPSPTASFGADQIAVTTNSSDICLKIKSCEGIRFKIVLSCECGLSVHDFEPSGCLTLLCCTLGNQHWELSHFCGCSLIGDSKLFARRVMKQLVFTHCRHVMGVLQVSCGLTSFCELANTHCCVSSISVAHICMQKGHTAMGVHPHAVIAKEPWASDRRVMG